MKKSITVLALSAASTSAMALVAPPRPGQVSIKTYCLEVYESADGAKNASSCDESANNVRRHAVILDNGCTEDQVALSTRVFNGKPQINISSCLPPNVAQL